MFFLYGLDKKRISVTAISKHNCISCDKRQSLFIETFRNYIYVLWLPIIPLFKTSRSFCGHCKQTLKSNEMPPDLERSAQEIKKKTTTPWYFFIVPVVISLLIALTSNSILS